VNSKLNKFDIFCNISHLDSEEDYPISVSWDVHRDRLYGQNAAIYSAQICDRQHCIYRTTPLTIEDEAKNVNETSRTLVCPVMGVKTTTFQNWERIERLNRKRAIIFKFNATLWSKVR
jgi:hypothetical protein